MGILLLTTFIITGCVQKAGSSELSKLTEANLHESIQDGATTKQEILVRFGLAHKMEKNQRGDETWVYSFAQKTAKSINFIPFINLLYHGTHDINKELTLTFNEEDTVIQHHLDLHICDTKEGAIPSLF